MLTVEKEVNILTRRRIEVKESKSPFPDVFDAGWKYVGKFFAMFCQIFPPGKSPII